MEIETARRVFREMLIADRAEVSIPSIGVFTALAPSLGKRSGATFSPINDLSWSEGCSTIGPRPNTCATHHLPNSDKSLRFAKRDQESCRWPLRGH